MANIYVGFHDQRSCNRILKPPGGGTSNIFGTDSTIPDIIPQNSPRKENKQADTIHQILQTETVTTVTRKEENNSSKNAVDAVEQNVCKVQSNQDGITNGENDLQEVALVPQEIVEQNVNSTTSVAVDVTSKVKQLRIEERSSATEVYETDSAGHNKVISSNTNSEGFVEKSSSCKKGSTIEDILKQDDIEEKKKVKGQVQRVPPGGYSSGLW